jgi:hypothetical protein
MFGSGRTKLVHWEAWVVFGETKFNVSNHRIILFIMIQAFITSGQKIIGETYACGR